MTPGAITSQNVTGGLAVTSKWKNRDYWPVSYRCEQCEQVRRGERDEVRSVHWFWFSALFILIVIAPAIVEWVS